VTLEDRLEAIEDRLEALCRLVEAGHAEPAEWLTPADVAKQWGCHVRTVHRRIRSGELPARRIGGLVRVRAADLGG
jgi:excisionase family DNA binding protein